MGLYEILSGESTVKVEDTGSTGGMAKKGCPSAEDYSDVGKTTFNVHINLHIGKGDV